ncbi:hypothetical protein [Alkalisalibacterium limincola]|uniref:Uncharacterized protein n=1 Tax=Alkalisalibacterium limincola TaxID=2699169 RepID=A0A5C8KVJ9_9GAMM|nr:hypothetical protein [Alkalisalibacterium limincola]TXK64522.1 hypothetical protein FU658_06500 [Alkalisalibacterium limincola]
MKKLLMASCLLISLPALAVADSVKCETATASRSPQEEGYLPLSVASIFAVLADPRKHHGRRIGVAGIYRQYYDRIAIYPTEAHYGAADFTSVIYADFPRCADPDVLEEMASWEGSFVEVTGVFNADLHQFGAGTLQEVELVRVWGQKGERRASP